MPAGCCECGGLSREFYFEYAGDDEKNICTRYRRFRHYVWAWGLRRIQTDQTGTSSGTIGVKIAVPVRPLVRTGTSVNELFNKVLWDDLDSPES